MASSTTARAREVIAELDQFEVDMHLVNTWVHGADNLTVLLGGVSTPTIKNLVKNFRMSAQEILDAAEYIQDNYEGLEDIIDANREYAEIAETLLLKIADWMARDLAEFNKINIDRYNKWYAHGIERIGDAGREALLVKEAVGDLISAYDESAAQHRLQIRLFDGTNPGASSKPVLFVISGQSNAVGSGAYTPFDRAVDCGWYWSWADGANELKPLADPIGNAPTLGSGWCAFARRFFALTGRKVILLNIASGGSVVTDGGYTTWNTWADNQYGTLRSSRQTIWNAFSAAVPATDYELGGILWDQGGTDGDRIYAGTITVQDFKDGTLDVWGWHRTLVGSVTCPIFAALIDYNYSCLTNAGVKAARKAIMDATYDICINGSDPNVHLGFTIAPDYIHAWNYYMSDSVHYNRHGYRVQGDSFARSAAHHLGL